MATATAERTVVALPLLAEFSAEEEALIHGLPEWSALEEFRQLDDQMILLWRRLVDCRRGVSEAAEGAREALIEEVRGGRPGADYSALLSDTRLAELDTETVREALAAVIRKRAARQVLTEDELLQQAHERAVERYRAEIRERIAELTVEIRNYDLRAGDPGGYAMLTQGRTELQAMLDEKPPEAPAPTVAAEETENAVEQVRRLLGDDLADLVLHVPPDVLLRMIPVLDELRELVEACPELRDTSKWRGAGEWSARLNEKTGQLEIHVWWTLVDSAVGGTVTIAVG